jgi:hypothetical protein
MLPSVFRRLEATSRELELAKHAEELAKKQAAEDHASREKEKAGGLSLLSSKFRFIPFNSHEQSGVRLLTRELVFSN